MALSTIESDYSLTPAKHSQSAHHKRLLELEAAHRSREVFAQIILLFRNPIDRAISQWNMERKKDNTDLDFEAAIA